MRRWLSFLLIVSSFVLLDGCASSAGFASATAAKSATRLPAEAPLDALRASAHGKVALVTFWATWCDACRAEMPALNRLAANAEAHGGEVIGVDIGETPTTVAHFLAQNDLRYPQWTDEGFDLFDTLGGPARIPRTLIFDRQGKLVYSGATFDHRALAAFRAALRRSE